MRALKIPLKRRQDVRVSITSGGFNCAEDSEALYWSLVKRYAGNQISLQFHLVPEDLERSKFCVS